MLHLAAAPDRSPGVAARSLLVAAWISFACLLSPIRADELRILHDDWEAIRARVDVIQSAACEIDVTYFAVSDDDLALAFLALLREASRRGVRVRLIIDAMYNDLPGSVQAHLIREGVEIREYHQLHPCRPLEINRRMHDKVLVADGCQMIVGSRNLDRRHFGLGCQSYDDRDAYVRGTAACAARRYFSRLWTSDEVRLTDTSKHNKSKDCEDAPLRSISRRLYAGQISPSVALDQALAGLALSGMLAPNSDEARLPQPTLLTDVSFLSDDRGRKRQADAIFDQILDLVANAQHSVIIESPYFVMSSHLDKALDQAQSHGVRVVVLTNSLATTDQTLVYAGYANQKHKLLARGIQLWEYAGPNHLHAKSAVIDGHISIIGSYNFDHRSEHLNTETAILSRDPNVAAFLTEAMAEHFANAWKIGPDGKPLNSSTRYPGADRDQLRELRWKRPVACVVRRNL